MAVIKVQKIPQRKIPPEELLATFCLTYTQYTFFQARRMPYKRIMQMLKVAKREHARKMRDLLEITVAPHTKKGSTAKSLFEKYSAIINE